MRKGNSAAAWIALPTNWKRPSAFSSNATTKIRALRLAQNRRPNPRFSRSILYSDFRDRALETQLRSSIQSFSASVHQCTIQCS